MRKILSTPLGRWPAAGAQLLGLLRRPRFRREFVERQGCELVALDAYGVTYKRPMSALWKRVLLRSDHVVVREADSCDGAVYTWTIRIQGLAQTFEVRCHLRADQREPDAAWASGPVLPVSELTAECDINFRGTVICKQHIVSETLQTTREAFHILKEMIREHMGPQAAFSWTLYKILQRISLRPFSSAAPSASPSEPPVEADQWLALPADGPPELPGAEPPELSPVESLESAAELPAAELPPGDPPELPTGDDDCAVARNHATSDGAAVTYIALAGPAIDLQLLQQGFVLLFLLRIWWLLERGIFIPG